MDRLRGDQHAQRQRLQWELADCNSRHCSVHSDDWEVLATVERLLGVDRTEPAARRDWWEE